MSDEACMPLPGDRKGQLSASLSLEATIEKLPLPFKQESFSLLFTGIYDSKDISVYVNDSKDFAFLFPIPFVDYTTYVPRVQRLGLTKFKRTTNLVQHRFEKIKNYFFPDQRVLEIGSGAGDFLWHLSQLFPTTEIASLEVDQNTKTAREKLPKLQAFFAFQEIHDNKETFDIICMFHVLEHIIHPEEFLHNCLKALSPNGKIIIEVPSLHDPLLTLYESQAYRKFYFQCQHPFVYSPESLGRLLKHQGFTLDQVVAHQRYGLENHLHWLVHEKPGRHEIFLDIFKEIEGDYIRALEQSGHTDSIIIIAERSP